MDRLIQPDHPIHELQRKRWSPRSFADRLVEPTKLASLLEAARWSPSCFNEQPWSYLVATKDNAEGYAKMLGCLVEKNQQWARTAPVLMVSVARTTFSHNGKPNPHARHDVGMATANLTFEATALGLFVHQMAGFDAEAVRKAYDVPPEFDPVAAIAIGYLGDPDAIPEGFRKGEVTQTPRKAQTAFVFSGAWGKAR